MSTPESADEVRRWRSAVRSGDCDLFGHANNAVYSDYLVSATEAGWPDHHWNLRKLQLTFRSPVTRGEQIEVECLPAGGQNGLRRIAYRVTRPADGELIAESVGLWELSERNRERLPPEAWGRAELAEALRLRAAPSEPNRPEAYRYRQTHRVQPYEVDHRGRVGATWFFRWGWAAMFAATASAGWPKERWHDEGFIVFQNHRDAELLGEVPAGQEVVIESRMYDLHRLHGTWEHRILCDGELVAVDRATGVFLNAEGRIAPPPARMMEDIIAGPA